MKRVVILLFLIFMLMSALAYGDHDNWYFYEPYVPEKAFDVKVQIPNQILVGDEFHYKANLTWDGDIDVVEVKLAKILPYQIGIRSWDWRRWMDLDSKEKMLTITAVFKALEPFEGFFAPFTIVYKKERMTREELVGSKQIKIKPLVDWKVAVNPEKIPIGQPVAYTVSAVVRRGTLKFVADDLKKAEVINSNIQKNGNKYKFKVQLSFNKPGSYSIHPVKIERYYLVKDFPRDVYKLKPIKVKVVPVKVKVEFDKRVMQIGDVFHFKYKIQPINKSIRVINKPSNINFSPFEVVDVTQDNFVDVKLRLFAKPGKYKLGPFLFNYENLKSRETGQFYIPSRSIKINSLVPIGARYLKPFKPPISSQSNFFIALYNQYLPFAVGLIILVFLVYKVGYKKLVDWRKAKAESESNKLQEARQELENYFPIENWDIFPLSCFASELRKVIGYSCGLSLQNVKALTTADVLQLIDDEGLKEAVNTVLSENDKVKFGADEEANMDKVFGAIKVIRQKL